MKKKVMIVEDSETVQEMLRDQLTVAGFEVFSVYNGFEALRDLDEIQPDVIITDIMMPKCDGLELCQALRNRMETSNIPFIFLSSKFDDETVTKGREIGAKFFIAKPFKMETVMNCLEKMFGD